MLLHVKKSLKLPNIIWKHSAHGKQTYRKHMPSQNHHVHTLRQSRDKPEMNGINAKCIRTNGDRGVRSIAVTHTSYTSFFSIPGDAACILKRCSAIAGTPYDWQIDEHVRFVHVLCVFYFSLFFPLKTCKYDRHHKCQFSSRPPKIHSLVHKIVLHQAKQTKRTKRFSFRCFNSVCHSTNIMCLQIYKYMLCIRQIHSNKYRIWTNRFDATGSRDM